MSAVLKQLSVAYELGESSGSENEEEVKMVQENEGSDDESDYDQKVDAPKPPCDVC